MISHSVLMRETVKKEETALGVRVEKRKTERVMGFEPTTPSLGS